MERAGGRKERNAERKRILCYRCCNAARTRSLAARAGDQDFKLRLKILGIRRAVRFHARLSVHPSSSSAAPSASADMYPTAGLI